MKTLNLKRAAFAAALVLLPLFAAAKQPLTHETMWLMKRVGAPVVSPDGKWVVFSVIDRPPCGLATAPGIFAQRSPQVDSAGGLPTPPS